MELVSGNVRWVDLSPIPVEYRTAFVGVTGVCLAKDHIVIATQGERPVLALLDSVAAKVIAFVPLVRCKDLHSIVFHRDYVYVISTGTNEVYRVPLRNQILGAEELYWQYPGVRYDLDEVHLNGLTLSNERLIASCFGPRTEMGDWGSDGRVFYLDNGTNIIEGLRQPHSPTVKDGRLVFAESKLDRVYIFIENNADNWVFQRIFELDGYTRGIAFLGQEILVGLSADRKVSRSRQIYVDEFSQLRPSALMRINIDTGVTLKVPQIQLLGREIYDVLPTYLPCLFNSAEEAVSARISSMEGIIISERVIISQLIVEKKNVCAEAALWQAQVTQLQIELSKSWNRKYMKLLKSLVKRIINRTANFGHLSLKSVTHEIFDGIYKTNYWRGESRSGEGSDLIQTQQIREVFPVLLKSLGAKSMLDIPCGDYYWMQHVDLPVTYIGADIVQQVVKINNEKYSDIHHKFMHLDVCTDKLPQVDLIFARDLLVHLSYDDIRRALQNMEESGSTWLLTTTFTGRDSNIDIITGDWRTLNLQLTPFNFPEPVKIINEGCTQFNGDYNDKSLGLWKIQDINLWPCSDEQQPNNTKS
jgi:hypothetical protein